jgi:uncharacterized membrane protein YbhN (UPF0104 family)
LALAAGTLSAVAWGLATGTNLALFRGFGLDLGLGAALSLLVVLYAGVAPPTSPGRLGVFHALTVVALEMLGVERATGLAYATLLYAIVYLPEILPGAVLLGLQLVGGRGGRAATAAHAAKPPAHTGDRPARVD